MIFLVHQPKTIMTQRIAAAQAPFDPAIAERLDKRMNGNPPLVLFTTLASNPRLFHRFFDAGLLDRGNLTMRQRELVIDRTCALCGAEYEWGVHVARFGERAELTEAQIVSTAVGSASDDCWSDEDRLLIRMCDALHADCDIDDALWAELHAVFSEGALMELLMLAGRYREVSYITKALRLPLEDFARRFPDRAEAL